MKRNIRWKGFIDQRSIVNHRIEGVLWVKKQKVSRVRNYYHTGDVSTRNARRVGDNMEVLKQVKNTVYWRRTRDERSNQPFIDSSRDTR
jgi:hypothetical protein